MIFDNSLIFSGSIGAASGSLVGQAVNGAGNVLSTNTVDNGPQMVGGAPTQPGDLGAGESLAVLINVVSAPTVGSNVGIQLIQADDAALSVNVQVLIATDSIPIASLPAGTNITLNLDDAAPYAPKRYMGLRFVNAGAIATASYFAGVVKNVQSTRTSDKYKTNYGIA